MINVSILHCFPSINQEYLRGTVRNYVVFKTGILGLSIMYGSVPSKKVKKEPDGQIEINIILIKLILFH